MPPKRRKLDHDSPLSISSQPKSSTLPEEAKTSEQQASKHYSSSEAKRTREITIEDELPSKQRKLNDGSSLSTASQSASSLHSLADVPLSNPSSRSTFSSRKTSGISTPADVTSSNSTSRSATPAEANPRKGGRPRADKQFPRQKELRVRTKLRTNRPVKNEIPFEVWQSILENCPLEFLLKAVNIAYFKDILLRNENVWKAARLNQFGHDMPDPPPGISEHKYANLLTSSGCHGCGDKLTRRVYWGFVRRWCDNCLSKNVAQVCISFDVVRNMLTYKFSQGQNLRNELFVQRPPRKRRFLLEDCPVYPWCEVRQLASLSVGRGVRGTPCVG